MAGREDGPYKHVFDLCERVDLKTVNRGALEALLGDNEIAAVVGGKRVIVVIVGVLVLVASNLPRVVLGAFAVASALVNRGQVGQ